MSDLKKKSTLLNRSLMVRTSSYLNLGTDRKEFRYLRSKINLNFSLLTATLNRLCVLHHAQLHEHNVSPAISLDFIRNKSLMLKSRLIIRKKGWRVFLSKRQWVTLFNYSHNPGTFPNFASKLSVTGQPVLHINI